MDRTFRYGCWSVFVVGSIMLVLWMMVTAIERLRSVQGGPTAVVPQRGGSSMVIGRLECGDVLLIRTEVGDFVACRGGDGVSVIQVRKRD